MQYISNRHCHLPNNLNGAYNLLKNYSTSWNLKLRCPTNRKSCDNDQYITTNSDCACTGKFQSLQYTHTCRAVIRSDRCTFVKTTYCSYQKKGNYVYNYPNVECIHEYNDGDEMQDE